MTSYDPDGTSTVLKDLESSSIWTNLEAVKNGHVYMNENKDLYNDDPIAIEHQIEILADEIVSGENR